MAPRPAATAAQRARGLRHVLEARDPTTSPGRLTELARDSWRPTRIYVAQHPSTPPAALDLLIADGDKDVVWRAVRHPATGPGALEAVAEAEAARQRAAGATQFFLRSYVVHHPNASPDLRRRLAAEGACACGSGRWCTPGEWPPAVPAT